MNTKWTSSMGFSRVSRSVRFLGLLAFAASLAFAAAAQPPADPISLRVERQGHTATALADGTVLLAGGESQTGIEAQTEVYDPAAQAVTGAAPLLSPRTEHTATRLADGQVLVIGGRDAGRPLGSTEIYDPGLDEFSAGPELNLARSGHSATVLQDGRVLVAGGDNAGSAEIYDPGTGQFTLLGAQLGSPRAFHGAALLQSGKVLLAGGSGGLTSAELYSPASGAFAPVANALAVGRVRPSLRVLPDGKVQIIGGATDRTIEVYDPADNSFGAYAKVLNSSNTPGDVLNTQTRAALLYKGSTLDPALNELLNRGNYSLTELPQRNEALVGGGVDSGNQILNSAYVLGSSQASVTTDKLDYAPGDPVIFSGAGWQPGESVDMVLHEEPNTGPDIPLPVQVADSQGNFTVGGFAPDEGDVGVTFTLTAWGLSSGFTAQTAFTDAELVTAELTGTQNDVTVTQGGNTPFTISMSATGAIKCVVTSSNPATSTVRTIYAINAAGTLSSSTPSGALNFFAGAPIGGPNCGVTWTGAPTAYSVNASVSAAATTPVGNYTITLSTMAGTTTVSTPSGSGGNLADDTATTVTVHVVAPADTTPPTVSSINRVDADPTNAASVSWTVTFSENVTGVDTADFQLASTGVSGASITGASGSNATYTVTASTGTGDGTLGLNLVDNDSIVDAANNKLGGTGVNNGNFTGQVYTIDKTKPVITGNGTPPANANGWNNTDVTVSFSCTDTGGSGVGTDTVAGAALSSEGAGQSVTNTGTCADKAGNVADSAIVSDINIDKTAPTIAFDSRTPAANGNGWNNTDVTVNWTCSDTTSGVVSTTESQTVSSEGANQSATGTCTDKAGNTSTDTQSGINIDKTAPAASATPAPGANANGWNNTDVTVTFSGSDGLSGIGSCSAPVVLSTEGAGQSASGTCTDKAGNTSAPATASGIKIDKTAPTASASASPAPNGNGWNNTNVTVTFSGTDGLSGIGSCSAQVVLSSEGAGQSASGTCTDEAGNTSASATASGINIDKTAPGIVWNGGPSPGDSYYFGFLPAAPTCTATDGLSGPNGCNVTGYGTTVGLHTLTATAYDVAANSSQEERSYTVLAWTLSGFYQPIDMNGVYNMVKGGSTVPMKFEVFAGATELTDTAVVKQPLKASQAPCTGGTEDEIELTATGGTSLRYDGTAKQFIYNWQTPKKPGYCYRVTVETQDGSALTANFKLK